MDNQFLINTALQYENKNLRQKVEDFESGKRYLKIQENHRLVVAGYIKEINCLKKELADAHKETVDVRNKWFESFDEEVEKAEAELRKKDKEIFRLEERNRELLYKYTDKLTAVQKDYEEKLAEKDAVIEELKTELAHAQALLDRDSTNTSLPTGQTPPGKEKHIPNSRRETGKSIGGQPGHERHTLGKPSEDEINEEVDHPIPEGEVCPRCHGSDFVYTGECEKNMSMISR